MIAIIQFKKLPGRRFEVKKSAEVICSDKEDPCKCAFYNVKCTDAAIGICLNGYYFEEVK